MKKIFLSNGQVCLVSDEDHLYLAGFNWWSSGRGYVETNIKGKVQLMHRIIVERMGLNLTEGEVDHIDNNPLNNQHKNLRVVTRSQNSMNACRSKRNTSGYKGVSWSKEKQKWEAQIWFNNRNYHLGYFDIPEEASEAYCIAAEKHFGEFARIE